jgi:hypothetical protein
LWLPEFVAAGVGIFAFTCFSEIPRGIRRCAREGPRELRRRGLTRVGGIGERGGHGDKREDLVCLGRPIRERQMTPGAPPSPANTVLHAPAGGLVARRMATIRAVALQRARRFHHIVITTRTSSKSMCTAFMFCNSWLYGRLSARLKDGAEGGKARLHQATRPVRVR